MYLRLITPVPKATGSVYNKKLVPQVFICNNCYEEQELHWLSYKKIHFFILDLRRERKQEKHITASQAMWLFISIMHTQTR